MLDSHEIVILVLTILFGVIGFLLSQKDAKQADEIKILFKKHDEDSEALAQLRLQIAGNHYERSELDRKFDKLDATIKEGFVTLGQDLREMTKMLTTHLTNHPDCKEEEKE